jgi:uncharacterized repeat protein (TIGR01451 family)
MTPNSTLRRITLSSLALAVAALLPAAASASTAANTRITNIASVAYNDEGGVAQTAVTAQASFTVTLVAAAPTLDPVAPNTTIAQGQVATLTYTITANANGQETYTVTSGAVPSQVTAVDPAEPVPFVLGGTTLAANATVGSLTIVVPYDNVPGNASINGLVPGDTIVVGANAYEIAANGILKDPPNNTATITLTTAISGGNVPVGSLVGERSTFVVTVASGTVTGINTSGTHTVTVTVTAASGPSATQTPDTVVTVTRPLLTVVKEVSADGGTSFAATGVQAAPGTSLIYRVVVTNGGASVANAVTISDALPLFLGYDVGSARVAASTATAYGAATVVTDVADADGYSFTAPTITYAAPAPLSATPGANVLVLYYRATIQ